MKKTILLAGAAACALALPSCLQHDTTITLNKDGSGTLVEETKFGAQAVAMMGQFGGEEGKDPLKEMFSEEKAKTRAAQLGEGVTFEKSEPVTANGAKGAKVTYKFANINKLKLSSDGGMDALAPEGAPKPEKPKADPIKFSFSGDDLTIEMPKPAKSEQPAGEKPAGEDNPQEEAMVKQMMGDMKMSVKIVVPGGIDKTNATNRDGNTITLMEMDMGKILNQPGAFKKMKEAPEGDTAAAMELLKGIDGMKMETKEKVAVDITE